MNLSLRSLLNLSDPPALSALRRSFFIAAAALSLGLGFASACDSKGVGQETCNPGETKDVDCNTCLCEGGFFSCTQDSCYEPCATKSCGETCTQCDPHDGDCIETQLLKLCDPKGACVGEVPDLCVGDYDPCEDKLCGTSCTKCDPDDPKCSEDAVVKACDPYGECVAETEELCGGGNTYVPCEGKSCGDFCLVCAPDDPECEEDAAAKACDPDGMCVLEIEDLCVDTFDPCEDLECGEICIPCKPGEGCENLPVVHSCDPDGLCELFNPDACMPAYDPCEDKSCGDQCSLCDPQDLECSEDDVVKACDTRGVCIADTNDLCL